MQANGKHIFAAVFTQARPARGGLYLRQHLYNETLAQITKQGGKVLTSLQAALDILNADYRNLNPASSHVIEGVEIAVAFLDFKTGLLHVFSNGSCRYITEPK